jgi:hypothetical protein
MTTLYDEIVRLVGTEAIGRAFQGLSVSLSKDGNTLAVGGPLDDDQKGATWIFTRSGMTWTQQGAKLVGSDATGEAKQGSSVSLSEDGNTLAVGGPDDDNSKGATWIFTRSGTMWTQQGVKLVGTEASETERQGFSVSLSEDGNTLAVGGPDDDNSKGATWIFTRSGMTWTQQGVKLVGSGASGQQILQGSSVSLSKDGNTLAVGGRGDDNFKGATWIYTRSGMTWTQQGVKLVGSGASGQQILQGSSVSLSEDGNTLAVGGPFDDNSKGATWIFTRSGTMWTQQGDKLVGMGAAGSAGQGQSVSLSEDGNTLAVGGPFDDNFKGATWIFTRSGTKWTQQGDKLVGKGGSEQAQQGFSVSLSGGREILAMGGPLQSNGEGSTWIFARRRLPCVSGSTLVKTEKGKKKISEVRRGEKVLNKEGRWVEVKGNMKFGKSGKMYRVGGLYIRGDHPLWRGVEVMAREVGERCRVKKGNVYSLRTEKEEYVWMGGEYVKTWSEEGMRGLKCKYEDL